VRSLQPINVSKILACNFDTLNESLLSFADPYARVVILLVGLVRSFGIADLGLNVVALLLNKVPNAGEVCPLCVSVDIHLDHTVIDGSLDFMFFRARSAVEHEVQWLIDLATQLLCRVCLMLAKQFRPQLNISWLVDSVHVPKSGRDAEIRSNCAQGFINIMDVLRLGVQTGVVDASIVDAIFLAASDTNLHLEPETDF